MTVAVWLQKSSSAAKALSTSKPPKAAGRHEGDGKGGAGAGLAGVGVGDEEATASKSEPPNLSGQPGIEKP